MSIKECKSFKKYKGMIAPKCNGGNPCEACIARRDEYIDRRTRQEEAKQ